MKKIFLFAILAFGALLSACQNNDDLWNAIDDLKGRVQALETQVKELNKNVEALRELYSGKTITNVVAEGDKYVITLSDGSTIELKQGSDATSAIPVIGIDKDGFWQVSYDGGKTFQSLGVKATATDGVTPKFRIDETTGYWQVSYDKGTTYENVLDTAGKPVKAIGSAQVTDKFFDKVEVREGLLYIKLLDGTELNIPILKDFLCKINTPSDGVQVFNLAENKSFRVEIKGADNAIVTAPEGWTASLSAPANNEAQLSVTAPDKFTRATADNAKDIAILITSNGYASISKMQVELAAQPMPSATVTASTTTLPTSSTLTFDVTVANADGWKYLCLDATQTAPDAAKVLADGTAGVGTEVTVAGLTFSTKYKLYVVAYASTLNSGVQSAESTTTRKDFYELGITIEGITYDKNTSGVNLVSAATEITAAGVYFIDTDQAVTVKCASANALPNLMLIGRYSGVQPTVAVTNLLSMGNGATGTGFIFKNITLDASAWTNYVFNFDGTTFGTYDLFMIEDCRIETPMGKALSYFNKASSVKKTIIRNNTFHVNVAAAEVAVNIFNFGSSATIAGLESAEISNNVFYAAYPTKIQLYGTANAANKNLSVTVDNNTLVNCVGNPTGFISIGASKSISLQKNIIWSAANANLTCYMARLLSATNNGTAYVTDNKYYGEIKGWDSFSNANLPSNLPEKPKITPETSDPFTGGQFDLATGVFVPNSNYAGYGARLK